MESAHLERRRSTAPPTRNANYNPDASVLISTHLISDIEQVLDEVIFIQNGEITLHRSVDDIRADNGKSVDQLFREVFRW